ncbi:phage portal protein [Bacillus sp. Hm123]|uniref:phage portal protein n=1 Tax=Bacillus sp. Hm123 TaxID=3450745 RepID=UPI003F43587E
MRYKASMVSSSIMMLYNGQPAQTPAEFDKLAKEGFEKNVWVYRCVMAIARSAASIPIVLYQKKGKDLVEIEQHPLLDLLNKPNEHESAIDFREKLIAFLLLSGNAYMEMNGPNRGAPIELWTWRPDRVTIMPGGDYIKAFRYSVSGKDVDAPYEKIIHSKFFSPLDDFYGMGPIQVARQTVDMDNATAEWNTSLTQNHAAPSGFLKTEKSLTEPQFNRLKAMMRRMFGGKKNAGKAHLLEGGLEWQQLGLSPKDMDFISSRKMTREEICAVFGVPPQIVGIQDSSTYNNYKEARAAFYMETVLPTLDKIISGWNHKLAPLFGENLILGYDTDQIEALQETSDTKWTRLSGMKDILTVNEIRQALGYEDTDGGNVRYVPLNVYPEGDDAPDKSQVQDEPKPTDDDPLKKAQTFFMKAAADIERKSLDAEYMAEIEKQRAGYEKSGARLIRKRFETERKAVVAAYLKDGEEGLLKELKAQEKEWVKTMTAVYYGTMEHFGQWTYDRLKAEYEGKSGISFEKKFFNRLFTMAKRRIQKFIGETSVFLVTKISEFTRETLRSAISDGVDKGESLQQIAKRIEKVYGDDFGPKRAMNIARTEVVAASNAGAREGAIATGLDLEKQWVTTIDGRERESHADCNGQTREMNDPYDVGGHSGMFPGDPKLPAKERIKCRCAEKHSVI